MSSTLFRRFSTALMSQKRHFTVSFEGNIGCGKTTALNCFTNEPDVNIMAEPVDKWRNFHGHNLLNLMYSDPNRWGFAFESYVQLTRSQMHFKACQSSERVNLLERSLLSGRHCFTENFYRKEVISDAEYHLLDEWFKWLVSTNLVQLDLIVYLKATPQTVYNRLLKRKRPEEANIPLTYLQELHDLYEEFVDNSYRLYSIPVLTIDAEVPEIEMRAVIREHAGVILDQAKSNGWETKNDSRQLLL